jgi:hypothetical protein
MDNQILKKYSPQMVVEIMHQKWWMRPTIFGSRNFASE